MQQVQCTLARLEAKVDRVSEVVARIESQLEQTQRSCQNMDEHIDFVERVYASVRHPLSSLVSLCYGAAPLPLRSSHGAPHNSAASPRPPATEMLAINP